MSEKHPDTQAAEDVASKLYPRNQGLQDEVVIFGQGALEEAAHIIEGASPEEN